MLNSAIALAQIRGVAGTTVADLLERSGVARRSLYLNFTGGREEVLATSTEVAGAEMTKFLRRSLRTEPTTEASIARVLAFVRRGLFSSGFLAGCPVLAAALAGPSVPQARIEAGRIFTQWRDELAANLCKEGIDPARARALAALIIAGTEGAMAISIATQSSDFFDDVASEINELMAAVNIPGKD
nr:TetR family transcriptional regulator [Rhodococcus qingshengii]